MVDKKAHRRPVCGERVTIPKDELSGVVAETLPHEVIVRVIVNGEVEHRRYSIEFVVSESATEEVTHLVDG